MSEGGDTTPLVAIVDDDTSILAALGRLVRSFGFKVMLFDKAQPLLSGDLAHELSCALVDLQMPGMNGLELIQALARSNPNLPVVAMTAYPNEAIRQRALHSGAAAYLTKPFDAGQLERCLAGFGLGPRP